MSIKIICALRRLVWFDSISTMRLFSLPSLLGYAGALPFVAFGVFQAMIGDGHEHSFTVDFLQIAYAAMILSFLAGIHWREAVPSQNLSQLLFAMLPPIASLALIGLALWMGTAYPLIGFAALFGVVYWADHHFIRITDFPEGYMRFRLSLTIIVMLSLLASAAALLIL